MAEAPPTSAANPLLFGRYRVLETLGETRLASVYAATDERLHRRVLLHLLRKELVGQERPRERFLAEVGQSARRSHQALLEVFDSGDVGGRPFMVTEFAAGRPLRGLGLLTAEQALLYMRQVTGAVAVCQAQRSAELPTGLYHPPIASSNLLLVDEGRVKLVDSWLTPPAEAPREQAHYRAPELSEGKPATLSSDVYALGLLCYELLTGVRPVTGDDARAVALAHLSTRIPSLAQSRPALYLPAAEQLIAKATARYPEHRHPDAQALGAALDALWRDLSGATQQLAPQGRPRRSAPAAPAQPVTTPQPAAYIPAASAPAPAPAPARQPTPRGGLSGITGRMARGLQPAGVDPDQLRKRNITRGLLGWLVMVGLVVGVIFGTLALVNSLAGRIGGLTRPSLPNVPGLPTSQAGGGPLDWLGGLVGGGDEVYVVNIADGLNLRSEPDAQNAENLIAVVPNGTPVTRLEGPLIEDNIPWLRVRVELNGQTLEGWMSQNYLLPE
jgi:hypothetical protein